ncbi:unnamed protein product, partial [Linum tenue]
IVIKRGITSFISPPRTANRGRASPPRTAIGAKLDVATASMSKPSFQIILGSASTARQRILAEMGYEFRVMTADIDERSIRKDKPEELVMALAEAKADAIIARLLNTGQLQKDTDMTLLITADTVVVYKGVVREKPTTISDIHLALSLLLLAGYSGGHAAVVGSILVTNLNTGSRRVTWERAEVYFHEIPDEIVDSLIEEGITFKVAGGLMLEHPLTLPFVEAVIGNTDTVMGLPSALTQQFIDEVLQPLKA